MNVTLRQVRVFVAVAQAESFTLAAERLCLTQSTLTKSVHDLESGIGIKLFERTTRKVVLTAHGRGFLPVAKRLLNDFDLSIIDLREQASGHRGIIDICCGTALSSTLLPHVIKAVHKKYPLIQVNLHDDTSGGVVKKVASAAVDLGFGSYIGKECNNLTADKILTARLGVIFPKNFEPIPDNLTLDMLHDLPLIQDADDSSIMDALRKSDRDGFEKTSNIIASNLATQFSLIKIGIGPCVMSAVAASHDAAKEYPYRLIENPPITREIYVFYRSIENLTPASITFLEVMREELLSFNFHPGVSLVEK